MSASVRVLVADDNSVDRMYLSNILRKEGYEVLQAVNGQDAVEQFAEHRPEIVLLDVIMPEMDGMEAGRRIKDISGEFFVPVIFLTSLTGKDDLVKCLEAGGDDFLSKPYCPVILRAKLNVLQRFRQMQVTMLEQRDQIALHNRDLIRDQETASEIFNCVAPSGALDRENIRHLISPLAAFNGDVLLAERSLSGSLHILIGDFIGHGLTAAVGTIPLAQVFLSMTRKGHLLRDIVVECNNKLNSIFPTGYFCCVNIIEMNMLKGTIEIWAGGIPDAYITSERGAIRRIESQHLPLGILAPKSFDPSTQVFEVSVGDRLIMFTDGVLEARDAKGNDFGAARVEEILSGEGKLSDRFDELTRQIHEQQGERKGDDDITLIEIEMVANAEMQPLAEYRTDIVSHARDWRMTYELRASSLKSFHPLPLLHQIIMEGHDLRGHGSLLYTVLAELYNNALEHGVLNMPSSQKGGEGDFAKYYKHYQKALEELEEGFVRFECESSERNGEIEMTICVIDSGTGFDYHKVRFEKQTADGQYHGRGLELINQLCSSLTFKGNGNAIEVVLRMSVGHDS